MQLRVEDQHTTHVSSRLLEGRRCRPRCLSHHPHDSAAEERKEISLTPINGEEYRYGGEVKGIGP